MRSPALASSDDIDPKALVAALRRAMPKLIAITLVAGAVTNLMVAAIAPRHTAKSVIGIIASGNVEPLTASDDQASTGGLSAPANERAVDPHIKALLSPALLEAVAKDLHMQNRREFNPVRGPVDTFSGLLRTIGLSEDQSQLSEKKKVHNELSRRLNVSALKSASSIEISFTSTDPKLAAAFPNRLASRYQVKLANAAQKKTQAQRQELVTRIASVRGELESSQEQVVALRASVEMLRDSQKRQELEQQRGDLPPELIHVRSLRSAAEARAKSARDFMREGTPEIIPEVQRSRLVQDLITQRAGIERDLLKRSGKLETTHPVMKRLSANLSAVNRLIAREVANIVAGLDKKAFIAADQEQAIVASLPKAKPKALSPPPDTGELHRLESVVSVKRSELEQLEARLEAARARTDKPTSAVTVEIITPANAPKTANFPHDLPYPPLVMIATLLLGATIIVTTALAKRTRQTHCVEQPEGNEISRRKMPSLPEGSTVVATSKQPPQAVDDGSADKDEFVHIRDTGDLAKHLLQTSGRAKTGFRTLIATQLGPLTTACLTVDTANTLNRSGKQTLIIDWSLGGVGIARHLNLPQAPGFAELLQGTASFPDVVRSIPDSLTHFIAGGRAIAEGPKSLDADQLNLLLDALDAVYDHIMIVAQQEAARTLFETIQGRFDAGILIANDVSGQPHAMPEPPGMYLGFEVADIDLIRFEKTGIRPDNAA